MWRLFSLGTYVPDNPYVDKSICSDCLLLQSFCSKELHLSPTDVAVFISHLKIKRWTYMWSKIHLQKCWSFFGSRTQIRPFRSLMFFHWASRPLCRIFLFSFNKSWQTLEMISNWTNIWEKNECKPELLLHLTSAFTYHVSHLFLSWTNIQMNTILKILYLAGLELQISKTADKIV